MPPVAKKTKNSRKAAPNPTATSTDVPKEKLAISGQLDKKIKKLQARIDRERGVVIIRHLPHGFFEEQLKNYFQQFGKVTRLRLARSKRTGGSKGFAFVEFEFPEVAKVAAETMDNYLMFQRVVKAAYIPPEQQRYNYFKTSVRKVSNKVGKPIYVSSRTACIQRKAIEHNNWTDEAYQKRIAANLRKLRNMKKNYAHLGINFDNFTIMPNFKKVNEKEEKEKKTEEKLSSDEKPTPGSLLLLKKRKQPVQSVENSKKNKTEKAIKAKKVELKDLLENTLNDEDSSDDEEFIPMAAEDDDDVETSDEESYGINKDVDSDQDEEGTGDENEDKPDPPAPKKPLKVDRFAELMKRKPQQGGIQKNLKKSSKDRIKSTKPTSQMNKLKAAAVKEIKQQGNITKFKKADSKKTKINKKQKV